MALIGRIVVIFFALLAASLVASLVLQLGVFLPLWNGALSPEFDQGFLSAIIGVGFFLVSLSAFIPALVVVVLAEGFRVRSVLVYALAGGAAALLMSYGMGFDQPSGDGSPPLTESLVAAGIAAGFAYWLLAGRNAGRWRERADPARQNEVRPDQAR
jgi:hypothetical protein